MKYFQLASGHAMIAPFLKGKFGCIDSDVCWRCTRGRQSREHLFKEGLIWKDEIREHGRVWGRRLMAASIPVGEECTKAGKVSVWD